MIILNILLEIVNLMHIDTYKTTFNSYIKITYCIKLYMTTN